MDHRLHFQASGTLKGLAIQYELCTIKIRDSCFSVLLHKNENSPVSLDVEYSSLASVTRNNFTTICFSTQNDFLSLTGRCEQIDLLLKELHQQQVFQSAFVTSSCGVCGTVDICSADQTMSEKCRFCQRTRTSVEDTEAISMIKAEIVNCSEQFQQLKKSIEQHGKEYTLTKNENGQSKEVLQRELQYWLQRVDQQKTSLSMLTTMISNLEQSNQTQNVQTIPQAQLRETKQTDPVAPLAPVKEKHHYYTEEEILGPRMKVKPRVEQKPQETAQEKKERKKRTHAKVKMSCLLLFATIAFVGVVVGVVFITSAPQDGEDNGKGGNPLDRLITGGIVTMIGGLLILALEEYLIKKRGKTYGPFFDLAVGLAFFLIQGGVFALTSRGVSEWSILAECIAVAMFAVFSRIYLKNHIGGLPNVDKRFRYGGVFSWTAAVFSILIISWIAFPIWPLFKVNNSWKMAGEIVVLICAFCLSLESDRGFLIVSTTGVLSVTPVIWTAVTGDYLYGIMFFVLFGFAAILALFTKTVRLIWIQLSTTIMLAVAFAAQIVFYFTETKQDWGVELYDVIWIISLMYLPVTLKGRAPYALTYWLAGIVMTSFPAFCVFYPVLLVLTVITIYTHGKWFPIESDKKEDEELNQDPQSTKKKQPKTPEEIEMDKEKNYRWILRGSSIGLWLAVLFHTYVDRNAKYFIPIAFAISLVIDLRLSTQSMKIGVIQLASNEAKILYDRKFPTDWKQSILWTVGLFTASTSVSAILTDTCDDCIVGLYTLFCIHAALLFAVGFLSFRKDSPSLPPTDPTSSSNSNAGTDKSFEETTEAEAKSVNPFLALFPSHPLMWIYICSCICFGVRFLITETPHFNKVHWPYYVGIGIAYIASWLLFRDRRHLSLLSTLGYLCAAVIINAVYDQEEVLKPFFIAVGMFLLHMWLTWKNFTRNHLVVGLVLFLGFICIPARIVTEWQVSVSLEVIIIIIQCSMLYPFAVILFSKMELPNATTVQTKKNYLVEATQVFELLILCGSLFFHRHSAVSLAVGAAVACILITFQCQRYHPVIQKLFIFVIPACVAANLTIHSSYYHLLFIGIELVVIGFFFMLPFVRIYIDEPSEEAQETPTELPQHQESSPQEKSANLDINIFFSTFKLTFSQFISTLSVIGGLGLIYIVAIPLEYIKPTLFTVVMTVVFVSSISRWMENIYYTLIFPVGVYLVAYAYEYEENCFLFPAGACAVLVVMTSVPASSMIGKWCTLSAPKPSRHIIREFMWQFCFLWIAVGTNPTYNILQLIAIGLAILRAFAFDHKIFYFIGLLYTLRMIHIDEDIYYNDMSRMNFFGLCLFGWCLFTTLHPLRNRKEKTDFGTAMSIAYMCLIGAVTIIAMFMTVDLVHGILSLVLISAITLLMLVFSPDHRVQLLWIYPLLVIFPLNTLMTHYHQDFPYGRWGFLLGSIISLAFAIASPVIWQIPKRIIGTEASPALQENFKNVMWILAVIVSVPAYYANLAIVCLFGFLEATRKKWLCVVLVYPGFMALVLTVIMWQADFKLDLAPAIAAGVACAVTATIIFFIPRKYWVPKEEDKPIGSTIDSLLKSQTKSESTLSLVMEEQLVLWWLVAGMIVSYSNYERNEIWRGMIFPALALIFGTVEAVAGFLKSQHKWRVKIRTQGMLLMSIAVISGAAVSFSSDKSMIGGILLVVAGCMIIAVVILQLYWWNVFQKWMNPKGAQQTVKEAVADPFKENPKPHNAEEETLA